MPIHDWARVDAGIFHHFHQRWVGSITDVLNHRVLPGEYYALAEQQGAGFEPDVLTLKASESPLADDAGGTARCTSVGQGRRGRGRRGRPAGGRAPRPHQGRDRPGVLPAQAERRGGPARLGRSPGCDRRGRLKGEQVGPQGLRGLRPQGRRVPEPPDPPAVLDLQPPTSRDPQGIHGAIWDEVAGLPYIRPADKPLTLAAYEVGRQGAGLRRTGRRRRLPDRHAAVPRARPARRSAARGDLSSRLRFRAQALANGPGTVTRRAGTAAGGIGGPPDRRHRSQCGPVSTRRRRRLAAGDRPQGPPDRRADGPLDEPDRSVAQQQPDPAGVAAAGRHDDAVPGHAVDARLVNRASARGCIASTTCCPRARSGPAVAFE